MTLQHRLRFLSVLLFVAFAVVVVPLLLTYCPGGDPVPAAVP